MVCRLWVVVGKLNSPAAGQGEKNTSKGANPVAETQAKIMGLTKTSGYRSPEDSVKVGGHKDDDHTKGRASDFAGSESGMEQYAQWAAKSGKFTKVLWKGRNLITGNKVAGHFDHVHVSW